MPRFSAAKGVVTGGLIAGTCDILYAIIYSWLARGTPPQRILQSVASGLFGQAAFDGGWLMADVGLFLHFFIAFSWAILFSLATRTIPALGKYAVWSGLTYGFAIFWLMRLVVLPLSAFPFPVKFPPGPTLLEMVFHMFVVGLPIALCVKQSLPPTSGESDQPPAP